LQKNHARIAVRIIFAVRLVSGFYVWWPVSLQQSCLKSYMYMCNHNNEKCPYPTLYLMSCRKKIKACANFTQFLAKDLLLATGLFHDVLIFKQACAKTHLELPDLIY